MMTTKRCLKCSMPAHQGYNGSWYCDMHHPQADGLGPAIVEKKADAIPYGNTGAKLLSQSQMKRAILAIAREDEEERALYYLCSMDCEKCRASVSVYGDYLRDCEVVKGYVCDSCGHVNAWWGRW